MRTEKETGEIEEREALSLFPREHYIINYGKKYDIQGKDGLPVVLLHGNRGTHRDFFIPCIWRTRSDACDDSYIEVLTGGCL